MRRTIGARLPIGARRCRIGPRRWWQRLGGRRLGPARAGHLLCGAGGSFLRGHSGGVRSILSQQSEQCVEIERLGEEVDSETLGG